MKSHRDRIRQIDTVTFHHCQKTARRSEIDSDVAIVYALKKMHRIRAYPGSSAKLHYLMKILHGPVKTSSQITFGTVLDICHDPYETLE